MSLILTISSGVVILVISILIGLLVYFKASDNSMNRVLEAKKELSGDDKSKIKHLIRINFKNYNKMQIYLSRIGVNYLLKRVVDPVEYVLCNIGLSVVMAILGYVFFGFAGGIIGCIIGFFLLKILLEINNKKDNEHIIEDLQFIYENIKINTESGVFLSEALNSCYKIATCSRLKKALNEMITDISINQNIMAAIENFKLKFNNVHIDTFCTVLRQGYETGDTMAALSSVSQQLIGIQKAIEIKHKQKLENDIMKVMVVILIAIMVVIFYAVVVEYSIAISSY